MCSSNYSHNSQRWMVWSLGSSSSAGSGSRSREEKPRVRQRERRGGEKAAVVVVVVGMSFFFVAHGCLGVRCVVSPSSAVWRPAREKETERERRYSSRTHAGVFGHGGSRLELVEGGCPPCDTVVSGDAERPRQDTPTRADISGPPPNGRLAPCPGTGMLLPVSARWQRLPV